VVMATFVIGSVSANGDLLKIKPFIDHLFQLVAGTHQMPKSLSDFSSVTDKRLMPASVAGVAHPRSRRPPCIDEFFCLLR
jgi:hypothetical protein